MIPSPPNLHLLVVAIYPFPLYPSRSFYTSTKNIDQPCLTHSVCARERATCSGRTSRVGYIATLRGSGWIDGGDIGGNGRGRYADLGLFSTYTLSIYFAISSHSATHNLVSCWNNMLGSLYDGLAKQTMDPPTCLPSWSTTVWVISSTSRRTLPSRRVCPTNVSNGLPFLFSCFRVD